ncbi:hypothetical protein DVJ78_13080 [Humibacter sp. BT305]|nr:hypothetical protein DVJ78_13080 [Humibacter sp. BT305]
MFEATDIRAGDSTAAASSYARCAIRTASSKRAASISRAASSPRTFARTTLAGRSATRPTARSSRSIEPG